MMQNDLENLSESMEMYLVTIARLREGDQPVPLSQMADAMMVTSVSVNEMCRKLQDNGLLVYRPYKGAVLTETGELLANHTLRRHRLWEVFLVEKLHFDQGQADVIACELEHATTDEVIDRLDKFLGFPAVNPRGLPIPKSDQAYTQQPALSLTKLAVGKAGQVLGLPVTGAAREFLEDHGIRPGIKVTVIAKGQDNILVEVDGVQVVLATQLAQEVNLTPIFLDSRSVEEEGKNPKKKESEMTAQEPEVRGTEQKTKVDQVPLSELKKGQEAIIVKVGGEGAVKRRMMDMGVVTGSAISVIRVAPFGDPIEFSIKGYSLSLRKSEASDILVELVK
jgi:DtxR family transcriptional regulator, Mn-dependent transcriptional regulator